LTFPTKLRILGALFFSSGVAALIYEVVWIRLFTISFGNTAEAMSIVLATYLGGIAVGAAGARKFAQRSGRESVILYGLAELFISTYALMVPFLLRGTAPLFQVLYGDGHAIPNALPLVRAIAGSAALFPATCAMGATLPLLARWISTGEGTSARGDAGRGVSVLYSVNLAGATTGAVLSGFILLPAFGFARTLEVACLGSALVGLTALWLARSAVGETTGSPVRTTFPASLPFLPRRVMIPLAFLSGSTCFLYEVAWGRVYGVLFGPTASTLTLILAVFLVGLTGGGLWAGRLKRNSAWWLCAAQAVNAAALIWALAAAGSSPQWIADWLRTHSSQPVQIELMKSILLLMALLPLTLSFGLIFPLTMRLGAADAETFASRIGGLYATNTAGCIAGSVVAAWWLIPALGTERTLLLGGAVNLALALLVLDSIRPRWRKPALAAAGACTIMALFLYPRWDMAAMTAGGYKYAPYYTNSSPVDAGELLWVHEGIS
jgi:spermidine synthase